MVLNAVAIIGTVWQIGRNHVRRATAMKEGKHTTVHRSRIGFQPKAELDAEETRKSEMEARNRRYELEHEDRYEIEGDCGRAQMTSDRIQLGKERGGGWNIVFFIGGTRAGKRRACTRTPW